MITTKRLLTSDLIEEAGALLYKNYIEEEVWNFNSDNPSKLCVETKNNKKLLIDRFTNCAIWFGAFYGEKLVGCIRLFGVDESNKYEIEAYPSSQMVHQYLPRENCFEMTRAVVDSSYRGQKVLNHLYLIALRYCNDNQCSVFGTANNSFVKSLLKRIEFPLKIEQAFKYEPQDAMPVNFYFASYENYEVENVINRLKELQSKTIHYDVCEILRVAAPLLPIPVYWHDINGAVLGLNEHCLTGMGTTTDIIGKTPYDFYPKETAEHILKHNEKIMNTGEILSQEELIQDITTGEKKYYKAIKAPLYDYDGKVIGIVGTSVDISSEKEADQLRIKNEKLEFENHAHKIIAEEQGKFRKTVNQMVHDIGTPLASLNMLISFCTEIPEEIRVDIRECLMRITGITRNVLNQYTANEHENTKKIEEEKSEPLLLSCALMQSISEKKHQYYNQAIKFVYDLSKLCNFVFVNIQPNAFKRSISNIINNAIDAFEHKSGTVNLKLIVEEKFANIIIEDNGKGMSEEIKSKIMSNIEVTAGKAEGHGIGMGQVRDTLANNNGKMQINSELGKGTKITLTFPRINTPDWISDKIHLFVEDTLLILDDDDGIHGAWDKRFGIDAPNIPIKHFTHGQELIEYVNGLSFEQKEKLFLLTDYELLKQEVNGLQVVEKTGLKRSILVTSHYENAEVRKLAAKTGTKILPKPLASEVPIIIINEQESEMESKVVDLILVDDDEHFVKVMMKTYFRGLKIDYYLSPTHFLAECAKYPKETKICLDKNFDNDIDGVSLAKTLHEKGFNRIVLVSGEYMDQGKFPAYITIVHKSQIEKLRDSE